MPENMRQQARKVRAMVEQAASEQIRSELVRIAQTWEQIAVWAEAIQRPVKESGGDQH
jgi:hypothetical protein